MARAGQVFTRSMNFAKPASCWATNFLVISSGRRCDSLTATHSEGHRASAKNAPGDLRAPGDVPGNR
jgi:hypothetical protein